MSIAGNINDIRKELPEGVTLCAVSKYHPVEALQEAYDAGQRIFAESREQELKQKWEVLPKDIEWHFIGHLQTNKVKYIAPFVNLIQSVDSERLLDEIQKQALKNGRIIDVLLEVHIAQELSKSGFDPYDLEQLVSSYNVAERWPTVRLTGMMAMASFTDNEAEDDIQYYYKVYAEDKSMNRSKVSEPVKASCHMQKGLVMDMPLNSENELFDVSVNANHGVTNGSASYVNKNEREGISLDGSTQFVQLPYTIANHDAITISAWVYYRGGNAWQRIFDFGNGMFLTAYDGTRMRFAIKNGGEEEVIRPNTSKKPATNKWSHVAVTIDNGVGILYLDGVEVARNEGLTIKPSDIRPTLNYIGRSQYAADPLFKGYVNDFKVYNYALSAEEIANVIDNIEMPVADDSAPNFIYDLSGRRLTHPAHGIIIEKNKKRLSK